MKKVYLLLGNLTINIALLHNYHILGCVKDYFCYKDHFKRFTTYTWKYCALKCKVAPNCYNWTWMKAKICHFYTSNPGKGPNTHCYSGHYTCNWYNSLLIFYILFNISNSENQIYSRKRYLKVFFLVPMFFLDPGKFSKFYSVFFQAT